MDWLLNWPHVLELTFAGLTDALFIIDAKEGKIQACNSAASEVFGYRSEEMVGQLTALLHVDERSLDEFRGKLAQAFEKDCSLGRFEFQMLRKNGAIFPTEHNVIAILDASGHRVGSVSIVRDITKRRQAERSERLLRRRLRKAREQEQRRISYALHDSTAQKLAGLTMNLGALKDSLAGQATAAKKLLTDSLDLATDCAKEIRTLSYLLHPPLLDELGLATALHSYVEVFTRQSRLKAMLDCQQDLCQLSPELELALFRIVQESLTNVHRHSGSKTVRIRLGCDLEQVTLEIRDHGRGIPARTLKAMEQGTNLTGLGILGMRERLKELDGILEIQSSSKGTLIRARVPFSPCEP